MVVERQSLVKEQHVLCGYLRSNGEHVKAAVTTMRL